MEQLRGKREEKNINKKNNNNNQLINTFRKGDLFTRLSFIIMGIGNFCRGQIAKGILFLSIQMGFTFYMIIAGITALLGLEKLGTNKQEKVFNETTGIYDFIKGDNSMLILLYGVIVIFIILLFIIVWRVNIQSAYKVQKIKERGEKIPTFVDDIKSYFNNKLHITLLTLPTIGLLLFTVLPLVFMTLIAFTGFDSEHQPPGNLFTWVGLRNFKVMLMAGSSIGSTFWIILRWTFVWAIFATVLNYIFGILLAILINQKGVRFKKFWRTIFVLSIAVPVFVSLLVIHLMFTDSGAINILLKELGFINKALPFWTNPLWAKITVIIINLWVGIPHTMLITTGILMNIPAELYESAKIDGASPFVTFFRITMPYMLFVTTPYLITQFTGNINNFNVLFFLTGGEPTTVNMYKGAGNTDLLVTWLFKLTANNKDNCYAATIGILIFVISASISLIAYHRTGSYKNEEGFQ